MDRDNATATLKPAMDGLVAAGVIDGDTAAIVRANRQNGPEHCMQLAEERAPHGFDRIDDVFPAGELQAMADRYKVLTGMKRA